MAESRSVWMLGTGRCGSRIFAKMLSLSPDVLAVHDAGPLFPPSWPNGDPLQGGRLARAKQAWDQGLVYGESSPPLAQAAYRLAESLPNAKFVHLYRDPRNATIAGLRVGWTTKEFPGVDERRLSPHPTVWPKDEETASRWTEMDVPERCAWLWSSINRFILGFRDTYPNRCMGLPAEALFAPSITPLYDLFDWLEVKRSGACDIIRVAGKKHDYPQLLDLEYVNWSDEWDQYLPRDLMERLGYA